MLDYLPPQESYTIKIKSVSLLMRSFFIFIYKRSPVKVKVSVPVNVKVKVKVPVLIKKESVKKVYLSVNDINDIS